MSKLSSGQILNTRYRIVNLLGQGGFGAVYRAWDLHLRQPCAIKENLDTTPEAQRQFEREATILSSLTHPNLPRVTDHFIIPGQGQYLVMDFIEGEDLEQIMLRTQQPFPEEHAITWIEQICDALEYLHNQNPPIIHRDIKPANIKITPAGQAVLVDFGIAKIYDEQLRTTVGAQAVTPGYSPIEQYGQGRTDARTDIYALGATLYTMLTGQTPPESITLQTNQKRLTHPRRLNAEITTRTQSAILQAMALQPQKRFQTVKEFQQALRGEISPHYQFAPTEKITKTIPNRGFPLIAGLAVIGTIFVFTAGIAGILFWITSNNASFALAHPTAPASLPPVPGVTSPSLNTLPETPVSTTATSNTAPSATMQHSIPATMPPTVTALLPSPSPVPEQPTAPSGIAPASAAAPLGLIAFVSDRSGNMDIYTMNSSGDNITQITNTPYDDNVPCWSPDGQKIAYHSNKDGDYELYIINLSNGTEWQVTSNSCPDWNPNWSPDGEELTFYSKCDGNREIYTINIDGSNRKRLTNNPAYDWFPSWSPDGSKITFSSHRNGSYQIFVMNADGSNKTMLANGCISYFSPNGKKIIFSQYCGSDDYGAIYVMKANGENAHILDSNANRNAVWSPDGNKIVFQSERTGNSEIWIMDADGNNQTQITDHTAKDAAPAWQP